MAGLVAGLCPPFAMAGIALAQGDEDAQYHIATAPGLVATERTMFRVASISKVVTGQTLHRVAVGQDASYADRDIGGVLGYPVRNPAFPDAVITLGQVLSHSSGLSDAAGYALPPEMMLRDWLAAAGPGCFGPHPPGVAFDYCNLGYSLVAAAAEALGGDRFDHLAQQHVLGPLGIAGGFNWSGVSAATRADRLPTYRRDRAGALIAQVDGRATGENDTDAIPTAERRVCHIAQLSPQGGLRTSLEGCLTLARALRDMDATPLWRAPGPTQTVFESYGAGLQIFDAPHFYPRPLIGHFANAYGFAGGIWYDAGSDTAFAYALNGLAMGDESDDLRIEEIAIFATVASQGPDS